jgi:hypothetical protein
MSEPRNAGDASRHATAKPVPQWRTRIQIALVVVALLLAATGGTLAYLYKSNPAGWTRTDAFLSRYQNADLLSMAEHLQNQVITSMGSTQTNDAMVPVNIDTPAPDTTTNDNATASGDSTANAQGSVDQQVIRLSINEINAWLAVKADSWLQFKGVELPPEVTSPRIWVENGNPVLGVQVNTPEVSRPISATFALRVVDDGHMSVRLLDTRAGQLRIPHSAVASHLKKLSDKNEANPALDGFDQLTRGIVFDPAGYLDKLEDNRITGLTFDEQYMTITIDPAPK